MKKLESLEEVVNGGFCVGCGGCALSTGTSMNLNEFGEYVPDLNSISNSDINSINKAKFVCPSLNPSFDEDKLSEIFFRGENPRKSQYIGDYQDIYGGFVKEGGYRERGTSGGFGSYIGAALYERGMIDGVIHVKEHKRESSTDAFFKYGVSTSLKDIQGGARTKYHVVELSEILSLLQGRPGTYLLVGVPCMIKAVRRIQLQDDFFRDSIKYTVALICGHLKSINWTLSLAWGKGIKPNKATTFKYRTKGPGISARSYVFTAYSETQEIMEDSGNVVGGKFNQGALMLEACNFCDDVVGETADVTVGDAWLPQFEVDSQGTNMLIVRNSEINEVLKQCVEENKVSLVDLTEDDAKDAQSGGFRQRKEGLSYRLHKVDKSGKPRPEKRIKANSISMPPLRKLIYHMRWRVTEKSRFFFIRALRTNDYSIYSSKLKLLLRSLRMLEISSSATRIIRKKFAYFILKNQ